MKPLISIIVPVYNVEKYLKKCVYSIINQTYKNLEILLIDDGSTDHCSEICDEFGRLDSRIRVIHKCNQGLFNARKTGILVARGDYIGYVDSDDFIDHGMYENLLRLALENGASVVESGIIEKYIDHEKKKMPFFPEGYYAGQKFIDIIAPKMVFTGEFFRFGVFANVFNKLFKKEDLIIYQSANDNSNNLTDDVMCTYPCIANSKSIYITHECYYYYQVREDSLKRTRRNDIVEIIKKCYPEWKLTFEATGLWSLIKAQFHYFIMFLLMSKATEAFENPNELLLQFGGIPHQSKIVLYGAGMVGFQLKEYLNNNKNLKTVLWVDKNYNQFDKKYHIRPPEEILENEFDYVIISIISYHAANSALKYIVDLGVCEEKIRWISSEYLANPSLALKCVDIATD